jgi:lipoprotein-anchoring transpeptidase ErfK/SrfK
MAPGVGRGNNGARVLAGLAVTAATLALSGFALADGSPPSVPTGSTGSTGSTGVTGATGPVTPPPAPCPVSAPTCPSDQVLSNETTYTTWAYDLTSSPVRVSPSTSSTRIATLHLNTEDGLPEVYILLRQRQVGSTTWVDIRVPMRPNGVTGWVQRSALDVSNVINTELVLDRAAEQLRLYKNGRLIFSAPAGVGTPDDPTPTGHFWIREEFPVRGDPDYGPYAFGTSAYSPTLTDWPGGGVIGVHGTNQPNLVPGRPSHGCIRLHNADVLRLSHLVGVGTPLLIE